MKKITLWVAFLAILSVGICRANQGEEELQPQDIRIFQLLPLISHPPFVRPHLPSGFTLGKRKDDPTFQKGYYWGYPVDLVNYFSDEEKLKGCIIWAKLSSKAHQVGFDRFSDDHNIIHHLTASGLNEIRISRGKWEIFPFRELRAKEPKGKLLYELLVGLNTEDGQVLEFQLIYPNYLHEPTQDQKQLWQNFVQKTKLLDLRALLVAQKMAGDLRAERNLILKMSSDIRVEKRRSDGALLVQLEGADQWKKKWEVIAVKELKCSPCCDSCVEIEYRMTLDSGEVITDLLSVKYDLVDRFSFTPQMLLSHYIKSRCWLIRSFDGCYTPQILEGI